MWFGTLLIHAKALPKESMVFMEHDLLGWNGKPFYLLD
jgi:hypothetical protein